MQIKLLHKEDICDKLKTRPLYEENFDIGDKDFIDYYYDVISQRNEIVVVLDDDEIVSMVHLNPYVYNVCGKLKNVHYLVALATKTNYRKKGYMSKAIDFVINYLNELKEPFCYIVPENNYAEKLYNKFGFERVCKFNIDKFSRDVYDIYPDDNEEYRQLMVEEDKFLALETDKYREELSKKKVLFKVLDNSDGLSIKELKDKKIYVCQEV